MKTLKTIREGTDEIKQVQGTNCSNCKWFKGKPEPISESDLNPHGGIKSPDEHHLLLAKKGDLVTLPGTGTSTEKVMCQNKEINQFVNERMCCAYWDSLGTYREFK